MRVALAVLALVSGLALSACSSVHSARGGACCDTGCGDSCAPRTECCWQFQPDCCNSWDFYVPCDLIEGRAQRQASQYDTVAACTPATCACR